MNPLRDIDHELAGIQIQVARLRVLIQRELGETRTLDAFARHHDHTEIIELTKRHLAARTGFTVAQLMGHARPAQLAMARHTTWHLVQRLAPDLTITAIAAHFNRTTHSSIAHGLRAIANAAATRPKYAHHLAELETELRQLIEPQIPTHQAA